MSSPDAGYGEIFGVDLIAVAELDIIDKAKSIVLEMGLDEKLHEPLSGRSSQSGHFAKRTEPDKNGPNMDPLKEPPTLTGHT